MEIKKKEIFVVVSYKTKRDKKIAGTSVEFMLTRFTLFLSKLYLQLSLPLLYLYVKTLIGFILLYVK